MADDVKKKVYFLGWGSPLNFYGITSPKHPERVFT